MTPLAAHLRTCELWPSRPASVGTSSHTSLRFSDPESMVVDGMQLRTYCAAEGTGVRFRGPHLRLHTASQPVLRDVGRHPRAASALHDDAVLEVCILDPCSCTRVRALWPVLKSCSRPCWNTADNLPVYETMRTSGNQYEGKMPMLLLALTPNVGNCRNHLHSVSC